MAAIEQYKSVATSKIKAIKYGGQTRSKKALSTLTILLSLGAQTL
jgi:hypothetical protein